MIILFNMIKFKSNFFYGWVIVAVMATISFVSMGLLSLNFGLFIKPMGEDLNIGRATFGFAQSAMMISSAISSPIIGRLIDRFGTRLLLPIAATITIFAIFFLSQSTNSFQIIIFFVVMGLMNFNNPGNMFTSVPILKWFVVNRGKALSFVSLGIPFGAIVFIPLSQIFINVYGWELAMIYIGIIGLLIIVPVSLIFLKREPEDVGLKPDGMIVENVSVNTPKKSQENSFTFRESLKSFTYWQLIVIFSLHYIAVGTIALHRIPAFMDRGMDPTLVSISTAFDAVCAGGSAFIMGFIISKVKSKWIASGSFLCLVIASIITIYAFSFWVMYISMAIFGIGIGGLIFIQNYMWAEKFGRENVGIIKGSSFFVIMLIGGIGAPLAGYIRDVTGTYVTIWWVSVFILVLMSIFILFEDRKLKYLFNFFIRVSSK